MRLSLPWPDLASFPPYGLVRTRQDFDDILAKHAVQARRAAARGAPTSPARSCDAKGRDRRRHRQAPSTRRAAPPAQSCAIPRRWSSPRDGNSSRLSAGDGPREARGPRRWAWPCAPTTRARATTTTTSSPGSSCGPPTTTARRCCCPATAGSSASATAPPTSASASSTPPAPSARPTTRTSCVAGSRRCPRTGPTPTRRWSARSAAPRCRWASTAQPHYADGLLLVGDAGGMVNPFNGEGIAYAMESARLGAEVDRPGVRTRRPTPQRERVLQSYPKVMKDALGGYYTLGRYFAQADRQPRGHAAGDEVRPARAPR